MTENTLTALDRLLHIWQPDYNNRQGNINYLDQGSLARPQKMPRNQLLIAAAIVAVGAIIGAMFLYNTLWASYQARIQEEQNVAQNLERTGMLATIPALSSIVGEDGETILASFDEQGLHIVDTGTDDAGLSVFCIPSGVSATEAAGVLTGGIGSLSASQATKILNGGWFLSTDSTTDTYVMRYVDFESGSPEAALETALADQGFSSSSIQDSGVDDAGNTYATGTGVVGDSTHTWKVSTIPFSDAYSIAGMPDSAVYVGIRVS